MKRGPEEAPAAARDDGERDEHIEKANARRGLALFAVYLIAYGGFVFLNAFQPALMEATPVAGLNLAVLSGMALIAGAFALAVIYAWLCRKGAR